MYVIFLSSEDKVRQFPNVYGYYCGKTYIRAKEIFPYCDNKITSNTKFYTSYKNAENAAKKIADKCAYVTSYKIERG